MAQNIASQGFEYGVKHFRNPAAGPLVSVISKILEIPSTQVEHLLNLGAIYMNNDRQNTNELIEAEQLLRVHTKPRRYNCDLDWKAQVVFENTDFLVLNKPSGVPSHPSVDNRVENSLQQLSLALTTPLFITHRLDTLTEGLIVYAKNSAFVRSFNQQLQSHLIEKKYCALVETEKDLPQKVIHYMEPSPRAPKKVSSHAQPDWVFCELEILQQRKKPPLSWIKINLLTGRTHQIRAQLSELGAPIAGDILYGSTHSRTGSAARADGLTDIALNFQGIALRACELQFNWNGQRMQFKLDEEFYT